MQAALLLSSARDWQLVAFTQQSCERLKTLTAQRRTHLLFACQRVRHSETCGCVSSKGSNNLLSSQHIPMLVFLLSFVVASLIHCTEA